jgi:glycolate oxidase iron-sulfur subunit
MRLRQQLPAKSRAPALPAAPPQPLSRVLLLQGCVQRVATPEVNAALANLLAKHNIAVTFAAAETCCGSLSLHLGEASAALEQVRANLRALGPLLQDHDAVISTASGCGVTLKDYQRLLDSDDELAPLAHQFVRKLKDVSEYLAELGLPFDKHDDVNRVAVHVPCTLMHGQGLGSAVSQLLSRAGYELVAVPDAHLCCGSAGTYSLLQPELSEEIRARKLDNLQLHEPDVIVSANIGCQMHLGAAAAVPVRHWIEMLA